ncbi:MAG: pyridoxamine 5'-phosphate oxidase family protein [Pseudomonadota bacterium]
MAFGSKLNPTLRAFIERQPMFFVATAARDGRVNISPKGMETLKVVDDTRLVWLNLTGSGNETAAHLADVNRMTLMWCAFEGDAMILRAYGTARTVHPHDADWAAASAPFPPMAGSRQVFDVTIDRIQTSCGSGVPFMAFEGGRGEKELVPFFEEMGEAGVEDFWRRRNAVSIDGRPTGILPAEG